MSDEPIPMSSLLWEGFSVSEIETRCAVELDDIGRQVVPRADAAQLFAEREAERQRRLARDAQYAADMAARAAAERQAFKQRQRHREEVAARGVTGFEALHEVTKRLKGGAE